jgi:hypothetical protein
MTGSFIYGNILFPLVLLGLSTGAGLLAHRLSGAWMSSALVLPTGFALTVVICAFATSYAWLAPAAGPIAAAVAVVGFVVAGRKQLPHVRRPSGIPWAMIAAFSAFAVIAAPVVLTGTATWTGYTRIVDIAFQMDLAHYLAAAGRAVPSLGSSYHVAVQKLVDIGYPGGAQSTLGAIAALIHTDVAWCYQAFLAFAAAMGALAIYSLLGQVTASRPLRCLGAAIAIQPNLLYGYALVGGIKELTTASLLLLTAALFGERLPGAGLRRSVLPQAIALSASFSAFSFGIAPWLGLLLVALIVITLVRPGERRRVLEDWMLLGGVSAVLSLPSLVTAAKLADLAGHAVGGVVDLGLGNLAAPVPKWSAAGVWLTGDFRFPIAHITATHRLDVLILALGVLGVLYALKRGRWALAMLGIGAPIALAYWIEHTGPWIQFKAFTITATMALTLAFAGAAALQTSRPRALRLLGWLCAAIVSGGVLYGNAVAYHDTSLAPARRYEELAAIGKRYAGQGPALFPAFDEYAEYFLRQEQGSSLVDPSNGDFQLAPGVSPPPGQVIFAYDLNQIALPFLQSFHLIVEPYTPDGSRPPSNWDLVQQTRYFQVWRRDRPASDVVVHLPLSGLPHERTATFCKGLSKNISHAGAGTTIAYVPTPVATVAEPTQGLHSSYWRPIGLAIRAYGAGSLQVQFDVKETGRYSLWMRGSVGRPLTIYLDGRRVGQLAYEERYPSQWLALTDRLLGPGQHTLRFVRGDGDLHPGSGDGADLVTGDLETIAVRHDMPSTEQVRIVPASAAGSVCRAPVGYEWMEVLRPGAASAQP